MKKKINKECHAPSPHLAFSVYLKGLVLLSLLGYLYYPTFVWMVDRWSARDSYYGHGFLIPLVSLYWLYKKRDLFLKVGNPSWIGGLCVLGLGAAVQIVSYYLHFYFLSAFSLVIVLMGLIYFFYGQKVFRRAWFPVAFLFLMIPLPLLVIAQVTLKMKFFSLKYGRGL